MYIALGTIPRIREDMSFLNFNFAVKTFGSNGVQYFTDNSSTEEWTTSIPVHQPE